MTDSDERLARLYRILDRARRRAALEATAKAKLKAANRERTVAEDYAARLAEKAKFRKLLADEQMDGWRFRWYFEHVEKDKSLEEIRAWIDSRVAAEAA